jgi:hypothetical protein
MGSMKNVSVAIACALLVLIAATLIPAAAPDRSAFAVAALVAAVALLVTVLAGEREGAQLSLTPVEPAKSSPPPAPTPAPIPTAAPIARNQAEAEVVSFLASLQEKGRLVDFLMDDISGYSDAEIGSVARVVHQGCKAVLAEQFRIVPVRQENEGSAITVSAGYPADEYCLVGKISGQAPFAGTLMHRGWKTESVKLPRVLRSDESRLPAIAPAEVELK